MKLVAAAVLLLVVAAPVQALTESGAVSGKTSSHTGNLELMSLSALGAVPDVGSFAIKADSLHGVYYYDTGYYFGVVPVGDEEFQLVDLPASNENGDIGTESEPLTNVQVLSMDNYENFQVNLYSYGGGAQVDAHVPDFEVKAQRGAAMDQRGIGPLVPGSDDPLTPQPSAFFTQVSRSQDLLIGSVDGADHKLTVTGDFVVEIYGFDLKVKAKGVHEYHMTGFSSEPAGYGPGREQLQYYEQGFVQLFVRDGRINIDRSLLPGVTEWAMTDSLSTPEDGVLTLANFGTVEAPYGAQLAPKQDGIEVEPQEAEAPAAVPGSSDAAASLGGLNLFWLAPLILIAGLASPYLRRVPDMKRIEAALAAGDNVAAARLASKRVRHHPADESAHLSRAIAWSRAEQHGKVVEAVGGYVEQNDPADGTLHYVLGLSMAELGAPGAQDVLREAARRTPELTAVSDGGSAYA